MVYKKVIVDADLCIKLGLFENLNYLERLLPLLADDVYIHEAVYDEIRTNKAQINRLISSGKLKILYEKDLSSNERLLYKSIYQSLSCVMMNKHEPNKNRGEVSSLAMAKIKAICYFATDETNLQPIIDARLNTGIDDIHCIRIIDIIMLIKDGTLSLFNRRDAKIIWRMSGKNKNDFDQRIWPLSI